MWKLCRQQAQFAFIMEDAGLLKIREILETTNQFSKKEKYQEALTDCFAFYPHFENKDWTVNEFFAPQSCVTLHSNCTVVKLVFLQHKCTFDSSVQYSLVQYSKERLLLQIWVLFIRCTRWRIHNVSNNTLICDTFICPGMPGRYFSIAAHIRYKNLSKAFFLLGIINF